MAKIRILFVFVVCVLASSSSQVVTEPFQLKNETDSLFALFAQSTDIDSAHEELDILSNNTINAVNNDVDFTPSSRVASLPSDLGGILQILSNPESFFQIFSVESLSLASVSSACREDMAIFIQGIANGTDWALRMIDAMGKPHANLQSGQTKFLGSYEECTSTHATLRTANGVEDTIDGKYCSAYFGLPGVPTEIFILGYGYLQLGVCLPKSCSATDLEKMFDIVQYVLLNSSAPLRTLYTCQEGQKDFDAPFYVATSILTLLGSLVLLGTIYDVMNHINESRRNVRHQCCVDEERDVDKDDVGSSVTENYNRRKQIDDKAEKGEGLQCDPIPQDIQTRVEREDHGKSDQHHGKIMEISWNFVEEGFLSKCLLAFSCYTNGSKILSTKQHGSLGAVNGIRFLSMAWVILGHTVYYCQRYDSNLAQYAFGKINDWSFMAIWYATPSVDSFFTLSGILVAYLSLNQLEKVGGAKGMNWFMFYFHRFWRLTPAYMLVLMVGAFILPYTQFGPLWNSIDMPEMGTCGENWWTNLLYVNNYVKTKEQCMSWSWYLANDMQYYWISPIFILPLFYNFGVGILPCLALMIGSSVAVGKIAYEHRYPAQTAVIAILPPESLQLDGDYSDNLYIPSYSRIGPYIVGSLTGYLLYRWRCTCKIPRILNCLCWFLSVGVNITVIYSLYSDNEDHFLTVLQSSIYFALARTAWGVAVSWMVFSCATGNGGLINQVLSWKAFIPLGRLSYCAYLIHPLIIYTFYSSRMVTTYVTDYELIYLFLFYISLTYGLAFIVSLVFESPMMALEKIVFSNDRK